MVQVLEENIEVDGDDGDGTVDCDDCCLPGVFNISIRLLSIKFSLKESVLILLLLLPLLLFVKSLYDAFDVLVYVCWCDDVVKCTLAGIRLHFDKDNGISGLDNDLLCC